MERIKSIVAWAFVTLAAISISASAMAAEIKGHTFTGDNGQKLFYISYVGETVEGDADKLENVILNTQGAFTGSLYLSGPGGAYYEAKKIVDVVKKYNINTTAEDQCHSACSIIWLAGAERKLWNADVVVGLHFPYIPDTSYYDQVQKDYGHYGLKAMHQSSAIDFMKLHASLNLRDYWGTMEAMSLYPHTWTPTMDQMYNLIGIHGIVN